MQPELVILVGNIGTGKSTVSKGYAIDGYYIICRDSLRSMLGAGRYIFEKDTEEAIHDSTTNLFIHLLLQRKNIVIDETNMDKRTRKRFISIAKYDYKYKKITAVIMPQLSKEDCIVNRMKDTLRGTPLHIWEEVWEKFNKRYQEPTLDEGFDEIIKRERK